MKWFGRKKEAPVERLMPTKLSYLLSDLQGLGTRSGQEDSFGFVNAMDNQQIQSQGLLAVLADGMGGLRNGKQASSLAIESVAQSFQTWNRTVPLGPQLKQAAHQANQVVHQTLQGDGGTTLIICLFYQETLYWASVGDSFCFLQRDNQLYQLNQLQTYRTQLYLEEIQSGGLHTATANQDPNGHRLSSYIGASSVDAVNYSVHGLALQEKDVVMLCSDGVGGVIAPANLQNYLQNEPAMACALMQENILQQNRIHQDNFTALVIQCVY